MLHQTRLEATPAPQTTAKAMHRALREPTSPGTEHAGRDDMLMNPMLSGGNPSFDDALIRSYLGKLAPGGLAQSPADRLAEPYRRLVQEAVQQQKNTSSLVLALVRALGGLKLEGTLPDAQKARFRPRHAQPENTTSNDGSEFENHEQHPELRTEGNRGYCIELYVA
ncbi:MAG: hypothetical protein AAF550_14300, partial [Myxococcota bacterium]